MTLATLTPLRPALPDPDSCPLPAELLTPLPLGQWLAGEGRVGLFRPGHSGACPLAVFARAALGLRGASVGWGPRDRVILRATDRTGTPQTMILPPWCAAYVHLVDCKGGGALTPARALALLRLLPASP